MGILDRFKRSEPAGESKAEQPRRRYAPVRQIMKRAFKAGQADRLTASWTTMPMPADDIVRRNQRTLVARSREQTANNDYGRAFLRMCRQNIIGPRGIMLQAQSRDPNGELDQLANDAIERAYHEWSRPQNCDVTGRWSRRAIENQCVESAARDGEFMVHKIFGPDAGPWGFALQILDPQRCPPDFDVNKLPNGRFIRHGIEFNRYGRPLAFYFTTTDAQEPDYSYGGRTFRRIPADEIIHGFVPDFVNQKRGLPWMATALWRLNMLGGFEEAALVAARTGASKMVAFKWKEGYGPELDEDEEIEWETEPGEGFELPAGAEPVPIDWQYPNGEFGPFHKSMLRGIASGLGVAYNNLANDLEGVNFSSIRQGTLDEREHWKELQEWITETLAQPVFDAWLPRALLSGRIRVNDKPLKPERLDKYREVVWQPRRWQWIDPVKDVQAATASKNNLLASPGQIIREQGRDPDTVWREIARDIEAMRRAGIPDEFITLAMGQKMQDQGGQSNGRETNED